MIVVMLPLAYVLAPGHMIGHGAFYASGLPGMARSCGIALRSILQHIPGSLFSFTPLGGLDYVMLVMIKMGWMSKKSEKSLNTMIQLWIRAPGGFLIGADSFCLALL